MCVTRRILSGKVSPLGTSEWLSAENFPWEQRYSIEMLAMLRLWGKRLGGEKDGENTIDGTFEKGERFN